MRIDLEQQVTGVLNRLPRRLRALGALLLLAAAAVSLMVQSAHAVSASYSFVRTWGSLGSGDSNFDNPTGITSDGASKIYVADQNNRKIKVFDKKGTLLQQIPAAGQLPYFPYGIAYDATYSQILVSDGTSRIYRYNASDGSSAGYIVTNGAKSIAVSGDYLYFIDTTAWLYKYTTSGGYVNATYRDPNSKVAADSSGFLYIAETNYDKVLKFNASNLQLVAQIDTGPGSRPTSIAVSQDKVYVGMTGPVALRAYDINLTTVLYEWGKTLGTPGKLHSSSVNLGLTVQLDDPYVVDDANHRIVQYTEGIHTIPQTGSTLATTEGDDGDLRMGRGWTGTRFNQYDFSVGDKTTGLLWATTSCYKCYGGAYCLSTNCCGTGNTVKTFNAQLTSWSDALEYPVCLNAMHVDGFTDWRSPNINELSTLVNMGAADPGAWIRATVPMLWIQSQKYFSSTVSNSNNSEVLAVDFTSGLVTGASPVGIGYAAAVRTDSSQKPATPPYRTGQTECFQFDLNGAASCPFGQENPIMSMQDGAVQAGVPWPQPRMIDYSIIDPNRDVLLDATTGLSWLKSGVNQCNPWGEYVKEDGLTMAIPCLNQNSHMGISDWRMPNISELKTINYHGPAATSGGDNYQWLYEQGFSVPPGGIWSSTIDAVTFGQGGVNHSLQIDLKSGVDRSILETQSDTILAVAGGEPGHGIAINSGSPVTSSQQVILAFMPPNPAQLTDISFSSDNKATWTPLASNAGRFPYTLPAGEDGLRTVWVRYSWADGSTEDYSASITLDTLGPHPFASPAGGSFNAIQLVTLYATEPVRFYYRTDGTEPSFLDGRTNQTGLSPLPIIIQPTSGGTVIKYKARDAADHLSPTYTQTYYLDTSPPSGGFWITSGTLGSSRTVTLSLGASGDTSQVRFSEDSGVTRTEPWFYMTTAMFTFTSPGDGTKCLSAQFMDEATNWSAWTTPQQCYNLDTVPPQAAVDKSNVWYNAPVNVTLTCSDQQAVGCSGTCTPSGCAGIYYTTDGSIPTLASPRFLGSSGILTISADTDLRYFGIDNAANVIPGPYPVQQFRFNYMIPLIGISGPDHGAKLASLPDVSGTVDHVGGSGLNRVEIRITDGTNYVKSDQTIGPGETWIPLTQANGGLDIYGNWSFTTNSVPWTKPGTYTITARAYDNAGNVSSDASRSFSIWNPGDTATSFILTSQSIKNGGTVNLRGKLTRIPEDPAYSLIGQTITITVTDPLEYGPPLVASYVTATTDNDGHFQLDNITGLGGFTKEGTYTVTASFAATPAGTPVLTASSASLPVMVGATAGYAIIVEGKLNNDPESTTSLPHHNLAHSKTVQRVYETLKSRGFADMDIYNLNYDSAKPGVDAAPDKALIQALLTTTGATYGSGPFSGQSTIVTKMINNPGPLYLVLVDHGDPDKFYIDSDSTTVTITPTELKGWLETYEQALAPFTMPSSQKRIIINGSCYSGSFIPILSAPGRIIVTSAAASEQSFKGAMEYDGVRSGEFFLEEFFARLKTGDTLKAAFDYASDKVRTYTRSGSSNSTIAPYFDTAIQHPLLDDDASGSGSNSLSTAVGDGVIAAGLYLGFANDTTNAGNPAQILGVTDTIILTDTSSAALTATTANYSKTLAAWVEIREPDTIFAGNGNKTQLDPTITKTVLSPTDPNGSVSGDEYFGITYNSFNKSGMYEIYYYAQESVSGQPGDISPMKRSVVYRNYSGNAFPEGSNFNLVSPANNATLQPTRGLIFEWENIAPSSIPPENSVTYTLEIADNSGFTNNGPGTYFKRELIAGNSTIIGSEGGLKPLIPAYYWKVTVVDRYGATKVAANAPFTFGTDNGNITQITAVTVKVYDSATLAPVNDAVVTVATTGLATSGNTCTTGKLSNGTTGTAGQCSLAVNAGMAISLEAAKPASYQLRVISINAPITNPPPILIPLTGSTLQPLKIGTNYYADLAAAYAAAPAGSKIQLKAQAFTGPFDFSRSIAVTLEGGYDATYSASRSGYTELTGAVIISGATGCQVTFDQVVVR